MVPDCNCSDTAHDASCPWVQRFWLVRDVDVSGVSGTGRVAEGFVFEDGTAVLRWLTEHRSTAVYASIEELDAIHGHNGSTRIVRVNHD